MLFYNINFWIGKKVCDLKKGMTDVFYTQQSL
ncbi:MAG: hypothetical protein ACI9VL_000396, partial [Colwellia sp.]